MSDASERFLEALSALDEISTELSADDARDSFDEATLQVFWKQWPHVSSWAGGLWRRLNEDLATPATPPTSPEDEVGGPG